MRAIDVRAILQGKNKEIVIPLQVISIFESWKMKRKEIVSSDATAEEIFYAGYILSNPCVRDLYREHDELNKVIMRN